jgi:hypothetical protein
VLPVSLVIEHGRRYLRGCSFVMVSTKLECKAAIVKKTADALAGGFKRCLYSVQTFARRKIHLVIVKVYKMKLHGKLFLV